MDFDFDLEQITPVNTTSLIIDGTGALTLPVGTTGERPGTPVNGMIRYNSTTNLFEAYENSSWTNVIGGGGGLNNIVEDTTPQLGGNLDVNGFEITAAGANAVILRTTGTSDVELISADDVQLTATSFIELTGTGIRVNGPITSFPVGSNNNLTLTPDGTGNLVLDGINWPQADGSLNQILETDGAGQLSFVTPSSGGPTFADDVFRITGSVDATKLLAFEVDGLTTATTRTITMPDQDIDLTPSSGTFAASSTTITAGAGLTGGGDLSANRTLDVGAGSGIAVNADDVALDINSLAVATIAAGDFVPFWDITATATNKKITFANFEGTLNHDNLAGFVTDEHVAHTGVTLTAGTGMTGGGDISASRTFNVIGGEGITANADDIELDYTVATVTAASGDFIQISDASNAGAVRKVDASDFLSGGGGTANDAVQARRTTAVTITTAFQDITMDATDVETDAAVIEHDNTNTDDIDIKVTGTYEISYDIDLDTSSLANGDTWDIFARVRLNDGGTGIAGSHASTAIWQDNSVTGSDFMWHLSCSCYANLTASDFVTLQIDGNDNAGSGGTPLTTAGNLTLKVKRLI